MTHVDRWTAEDDLLLADAEIEIDLRHREANPLRVDLIFYDVDHKRDSYEGRIFLNQPDATSETPRDVEHGYAGSYWVFGHDRCAGDARHCDPSWGEADDAFDYRRAHHALPHTMTVEITDAVAAEAQQTDRIRLTVVAVRADVAGANEQRPLIRFDQVRLVTYA